LVILLGDGAHYIFLVPAFADSEDSDGEFLEDIVGAKKNEPSKSEYEKRTEKVICVNK